MLLDPGYCKWCDAGGEYSHAYPNNIPLAPAQELLVLLGLVLGDEGRGSQLIALQISPPPPSPEELIHNHPCLCLSWQGIMLAGDGYRGKTSPHTPNERFEGATVLKALKVEFLFLLSFCPLPSSWHGTNSSPFVPAQYGYEGRVPLKSARLFYDISEKARRIVESYFMLNSTLYFSYTHLVCRTALSGEPWGWHWAGVESPMGGGSVASGDMSLGVSFVWCFK